MLDDAFAKGLIEQKFVYGNDFGSPDETYLSSQFDRPVMVHRYPAAVKAFYMEPDPQNPSLALCVDVLAPEGYGEVIGGSQRVASYELLKKRIEEHQLPLEAFSWYLDLRRYGSVPHAGFRHGHRARGGVGVRPGACAGDDSIRADSQPDLSLRTWQRTGNPITNDQTAHLPAALHGGVQALPPRQIRILGVPLDLGQSRRGVDMGPSAVRVAGLEARLEALGHVVTDGGNVPVAIAETRAPANRTQNTSRRSAKPANAWRAWCCRRWRKASPR